MRLPAVATVTTVTTAMAGFGDWFRARRDALLTSARFQRWALGFPPARRVARRRAQALFDLCAGFVYSQVLDACVRLEVCETLRPGPRTTADIAAAIGLEQDAAALLLEAAASLDLLERRGPARFGLGPLGAALLANPGVRAMVRHHGLLYDDLRDTLGLLRGAPATTRLRDYWSYAAPASAAPPARGSTADYSALMDASQPLVADEILRHYPMAQHRRVLDVGGGEGAFLAAVGRASPTTELALFDLPEVATRARARLTAQGLAGRSVCHEGDFLRDPLPEGADLVTLVRIVHDHDDPSVLELFGRVRRALPAGGRLLVAEPMAGAEAAGRMCDAYLALYLRAMGQGRPRTPARLESMLRASGFRRVMRLPTAMPMVTSLIVADV